MFDLEQNYKVLLMFYIQFIIIIMHTQEKNLTHAIDIDTITANTSVTS
jgi:hypothetical protein